jgi:quercetin dioxygenase-like cupin family protein
VGVRRFSKSDVPVDRAAIDGRGFSATFASFDAPERKDTWHHHGEHDVVAYLLSGGIIVETPDDAAEELQPGDLVHIERGTIHREIYRGHVEMVGFTVGNGPGRIEASDNS